MIRIIAISLIALLSACCQTKTVTHTEVKETRDTDTVYVSVPVTVPAAESTPVHINLKTLCDSLAAGTLTPSTRISAPTDTTRPISGVVAIDSSGGMTVNCREEEFRMQADSVAQVNTQLVREIEHKETRTIMPPLYNLYKYSTFIFAFLLAACAALLMYRR